MIPEDMISRVAVARGVTVAQLRSKSRVASIAHARHEAMFVLRHATELSFPEIGRLLGGRDHSTVMYGVARIGGETIERPSYGEELLGLVRPVRVERLACANVSCSGCIPARSAGVVDTERSAA